nr:unnamed protein product [Digitaria exilis]
MYREIDIYNVYAPKCDTDGSASSSSSDNSVEKSKSKRLRMYSGHDPCYSNYIEAYFNKMDVQKSLHANFSGWIKDRRWSLCSGDVDGRVPFIGSRYWVDALGLPMKSQWQSWAYNGHR